MKKYLYFFIENNKYYNWFFFSLHITPAKKVPEKTGSFFCLLIIKNTWSDGLQNFDLWHRDNKRWKRLQP